jgi:hypothetical protein
MAKYDLYVGVYEPGETKPMAYVGPFKKHMAALICSFDNFWDMTTRIYEDHPDMMIHDGTPIVNPGTREDMLLDMGGGPRPPGL